MRAPGCSWGTPLRYPRHPRFCFFGQALLGSHRSTLLLRRRGGSSPNRAPQGTAARSFDRSRRAIGGMPAVVPGLGRRRSLSLVVRGKAGGRSSQHVKLNDARKAASRVWIWSAILTGIVCLYPVEYQITRIAVVAGVATTWAGALVLWWKRKTIRVVLIVIGVLPAIAVCMPGRSVEPGILAADYSRGLRLFRGVRYVWGGEGLLGIDCSGLVRKGLVWGQLYHGLRTFNGKPIRDAIALWWHDSSALALRDGYRGWTAELFRADSVVEVDHSRLTTGDLAVTADGIHVMAYLGSSRWIEADPDAHRVIEVFSPTDNQWFKTPVVFVRWKWLASPESPNQAVERMTGSAVTSRLKSNDMGALPVIAHLGRSGFLGRV